ncbi:hypothetical protein YC2023_054584 [Brassica napus]
MVRVIYGNSEIIGRPIQCFSRTFQNPIIECDFRKLKLKRGWNFQASFSVWFYHPQKLHNTNQLQSLYGPRVAITLVRFLPGGLVSIIRVYMQFELTTETLKLVWTPAMAAFLPAQIERPSHEIFIVNN